MLLEMSTTEVEPVTYTPPPFKEGALFPLTVLLVVVTDAATTDIPPPELVAVLP